MQILITLLIALLGLALFFLFPIRNALPRRKFAWATWLLILANVGVWLAATATQRFGYDFGARGWPDDALFRGDIADYPTLFATQFMNADPLVMAVSLWLLYLIGPVLEKRLTGFGLLFFHVVGGAAAIAAYGLIAKAFGRPVVLAAGVNPGLYVLLGLYVAMYPFEKIVIFYNVFFFTFCGTAAAPSLFLAAFAAGSHAILAAGRRALVLFTAAIPAGPVDWLEEAAPWLGLPIGFAAGLLMFGIGGFIGRPPGGRKVSGSSTGELTREDLLKPASHPEVRSLLGRDPQPDSIESLIQNSLNNRREDTLSEAYEEFRSRYPELCLRPGVQAAVAQRFEQSSRYTLAVDAWRLLLRHHPDKPVAAQGRLGLAKLLARDPQTSAEAVELLEAFLGGRPAYDLVEEARRLLIRLTAPHEQQDNDTYKGLSQFKTFRFGDSPDNGAGSPTALPSFDHEATGPVDPPVEVLSDDTPTGEKTLWPPIQVLSEAHGDTLIQWGYKKASASQVAQALAEARTCAVILLPDARPVDFRILPVLANFWTVREDEAAEMYRRSRGILIDDVPPGRAIVLARKLRGLGLPAVVVPMLPQLIYESVEDVLEVAWNDQGCENLTPIARRLFEWREVRLVSFGRLGLPGGGAEYRTVLDLYVGHPRAHLRVWDSLLNLNRSRIAGRIGGLESLQPLVEYIDVRATAALKTPSFVAAAKKTGPPLDFHLPVELDHYNRWFLYAGYGKYSDQTTSHG